MLKASDSRTICVIDKKNRVFGEYTRLAIEKIHSIQLHSGEIAFRAKRRNRSENQF
jgi:hypothetical protein